VGAYPSWSDRQFESMRAEAERLYVERYRRDAKKLFAAVERECRTEVEELLAKTGDLTTFGRDRKFFDKHPELLPAGRYITAPIISADTLKIVGKKDGPVKTIRKFIDKSRFPWLAAKRRPRQGDPEVELALRITAKLMAEQRFATKLRTQLSQGQERGVADIASSAGLTYVERKKVRDRIAASGKSTARGLTPDNFDDALKPGEYTSEMKVLGKKCDLPMRLHNGAPCLVECKVSNSGVNSHKRLNRETGGKHGQWKAAFGGALQTCAVIGGVFDLVNLKTAQDDGLVIFFDHDLKPLKKALRSKK
jgi:hypothetical protein